MGTTRRRLLRNAGLYAGGALLGACTGTAVSSTPPASSAASSPAARPTASATPSPSPAPAAARAFVETHSHPQVRVGSGLDFADMLKELFPELDRNGARMAILMPPPDPTPTNGQLSSLEQGLFDSARSDRLAIMSGGGSLNSAIQQLSGQATITAETARAFTALAEKILALGAKGFGEIAVTHLSFAPMHPFEQVAADHPLFFLLAEIAAKHDVPIDIHMDAITQDGPTPPAFRQLSPKNPATLNENVSHLERLLDHEPRAKIVWAHAGSDRTGEVTPQVYSRLMQAHPNLHLQLILSSQIPTPPSLPGGREPPNVAHNLTDQSGAIRAEYLDMIRTYSDRITVGGDSFFTAPGAASALPQAKSNLSGLRMLVDKLPDDVVAKVAYENAARIYKLTLP